MLRVDFEFYKGILVVRLTGLLTKYSLMKEDFCSLINYIGFRYVVINLNNVRLIDGFCINYLIKFNHNFTSHTNKSFICLTSSSFLDKFSNKVCIISKESEVLSKI